MMLERYGKLIGLAILVVTSLTMACVYAYLVYLALHR